MKMTFLGRAFKVDLKCLAEELSETVTEDMKCTALKKIIVASTDYEKAFVKELLQRIVSEREEIQRQEEIKSQDEIRRQELETRRQDENKAPRKRKRR